MRERTLARADATAQVLQSQHEHADHYPAAVRLVLPDRRGHDGTACRRTGRHRTCICRLAGGSVRYLVEWPGLSIDEKREGYILPCVAVARDDLVVDQRLAKRIVFPD